MVVPKAGKGVKETPKTPSHRKAFRNDHGQGFKPSCHMQGAQMPLALLRNSVREEGLMVLVLSSAGTDRGQGQKLLSLRPRLGQFEQTLS